MAYFVDTWSEINPKKALNYSRSNDPEVWSFHYSEWQDYEKKHKIPCDDALLFMVVAKRLGRDYSLSECIDYVRSSYWGMNNHNDIWIYASSYPI